MCMIIISWGAKYSRELVLSRLDKHCCKYSPSFLQIFKYIHSSQVSRWSSIVPTFCHQTDGRNVRVSSFPFQHQNPVKAPKNRWKHTPKSAISYPHHHQGQHQHYQYYISIPTIKIDMLTITVILVILHQDRRICSCLIWPQFVCPLKIFIPRFSDFCLNDSKVMILIVHDWTYDHNAWWYHQSTTITIASHHL